MIEVVTNMKNPIHRNAIADALNDVEVGDDWLFHVGGGPRVVLDKRRKNCVYWMGSDVYKTINVAAWRAEIPEADLHLTVHTRLTLGLEAVGAQAQTAFFFTPRHHFLSPPPNDINVAVYLPTNQPVYRIQEHLEVFEWLPDMMFTVYGCDDSIPELPKNCVRIGWEDPKKVMEILKDSTCLLRFTRHDGFPQTIMDAKMMGRRVVASFPYQGCQLANTVEEAVYELKRPITHTLDAGEWTSWYRGVCNPRKFKQTIISKLVKT